MTQSTPTPFRSFSAADMATFEALKACPRPAGWDFNIDHDETWDLISVQPPPGLPYPWETFRHNDPFLFIPAATGDEGVLRTMPDGGTEASFPSLAAALADVGPPRWYLGAVVSVD
jgi:hypothetical protein